MHDQSKSAKQAEDYIRYATKKDVVHKELVQDGKIKVDSRKSTTIRHAELANNFVKLASIVPMSPISRKIIQLRLVNPGISITGVSLQTGLLAHEIKAYETEGLKRITQYLDKTSLQEATDKFNTERTVEHAVKNLNMQGKDNSLLLDK